MIHEDIMIMKYLNDKCVILRRSVNSGCFFDGNREYEYRKLEENIMGAVESINNHQTTDATENSIEKNNSPETCEYKGVTYFVLIDKETKKKCIKINEDETVYLDKNGKVYNKQKGTRSVKTAIESYEDLHKIINHFTENKQWLYLLFFSLQYNTGRRFSDIRAARWCDFFKRDGEFREIWDIHKANGERGEQKTGKIEEIHINKAIKEAFKMYLENEKSIDFKYDYKEPIFKQPHGTHRGKVISESGYRKALDSLESILGYKIRSHSIRRTFGKNIMEAHPNDNIILPTLSKMLNHSSIPMTENYIGETAKRERYIYEEVGENWEKYGVKGEKIPFELRTPVSSYNNSELREYMMCAFGKILDMKDETDPVVLMKLYNELLDGLESIAK